MQRFSIIGLAVSAAMCAGCGRPQTHRTGDVPVYPVHGIVTYQGKPLADADVTFLDDQINRSSFGHTDDNGSYQLTTFAANDGAPSGPKSITITKSVSEPSSEPEAPIESPAYVPPGYGAPTPPPKPAQQGLPAKYGDRARSGLTADIKASGPNEVNLELQD